MRVTRARGRYADRRRSRRAPRSLVADGVVPARLGAGDRHDRPGLGADHEDGGRHRHRSRRAHLPRRHREPRARHSVRGRHRQRHRRARSRASRSRSPAPRARPASSIDGILAFERDEIDVREAPATRTKILVNVGDPEQAFALSFLPVDGVGLAREEFIIMNAIGIHPMALVHPERTDAATQREIAERTRGYPDGSTFFVEKLAEGVARIAAGFHPRPVIVRLSDFKTNEYAGLVGGSFFEPKEENPMIGFRGASRYAHEAYREGFALECRALRRVREEMGLDNVIVMIPFCRSIEEAVRVQAGDGAPRSGARRARPGDLRDVRDPGERAADRRVRQALRRLLDRLERPDPARARRRPRLRHPREPPSTNATRPWCARSRWRSRAHTAPAARSASAARRRAITPSSPSCWCAPGSTACRYRRTSRSRHDFVWTRSSAMRAEEGTP